METVKVNKLRVTIITVGIVVAMVIVNFWWAGFWATQLTNIAVAIAVVLAVFHVTESVEGYHTTIGELHKKLQALASPLAAPDSPSHTDSQETQSTSESTSAGTPSFSCENCKQPTQQRYRVAFVADPVDGEQSMLVCDDCRSAAGCDEHLEVQEEEVEATVTA